MTLRLPAPPRLLLSLPLCLTLAACSVKVTSGNGTDLLSDPSDPLPAAAKHVTLSAGSAHTCALRDDGSISCWGSNDYGQLDVPAGAFVDVGAGALHACAHRADGTIACWGHISNEVATAPEGSFVEMASGNIMICARRADDSVLCWWTLNGALTPTEIAPPAVPLTSMSTGCQQRCGLGLDGSIACSSLWPGYASSAALAAPSGAYKMVSAGGDVDVSWACAIGAGDEVTCWGDGPGTAAPVPTGGFASVSLGVGLHACGVRLDGTVACWGDNTYGQASPPAGAFEEVTTGQHHSCGTRVGGAIVCWGDDAVGESSPPP